MDNTKESVLRVLDAAKARCAQAVLRSEEHTSELQSPD